MRCSLRRLWQDASSERISRHVVGVVARREDELVEIWSVGGLPLNLFAVAYLCGDRQLVHLGAFDCRRPWPGTPSTSPSTRVPM
jgi:hypothetical protein